MDGPALNFVHIARDPVGHGAPRTRHIVQLDQHHQGGKSIARLDESHQNDQNYQASENYQDIETLQIRLVNDQGKVPEPHH